jgi:antirestriction protein ArdC
MDVYHVITNRLIEKLEAGCVPWHKPWRSIGAPRNLVSKKLYRGINVWLLTMQGLHLALLGDNPADQRAWRSGAQGRESDTRGLLADLP